MFMEEDKIIIDAMEAISCWIDLPKGYFVIPERVKLLVETCEKLQNILDADFNSAKVKTKKCPLGTGDVVISFEVEDLTITNIKDFSDTIKNLCNFEMIVLGNGKIRFSGIFPDVAIVVPIEQL